MILIDSENLTKNQNLGKPNIFQKKPNRFGVGKKYMELGLRTSDGNPPVLE